MPEITDSTLVAPAATAGVTPIPPGAPAPAAVAQGSSADYHQWANGHLSSWAAVWAKASGLPLTVMTQAANDDYSLAVPITPAVIASEQQVSDAFSKAGLIPVHVDFSRYVDTAFNATAGASS